MHRALYWLIPLAAAGAAPTQAQDGAWRVSEVAGDVRIVEGGHARPATRGALLSSGSVIAGARARAVLVRGRQFVTVAPNSTLQVGGGGGGGGANSMVEMILDGGNAVFRVDRREAPHFRVRTRYLAAVVRGTTFSVTVTPTGGSVQVTEGAVQVSTLDGGASDLIRPGMIATVGSSDLFQLSISGDENRTIRSPSAPAAPSGTVSTPAPAQAVRIDAPVGEAPVRLADATNGLLQGDSAIQMAFAGNADFVRSEPRSGGAPSGSAPPPTPGPTPPPAPAPDPTPTPTPAPDPTPTPTPAPDPTPTPTPAPEPTPTPTPAPTPAPEPTPPPPEPTPPPPPPGGGDDDRDDDDDRGRDDDDDDEDDDNGHGNDDDGDDAGNPGRGGDRDGDRRGCRGRGGCGDRDEGRDDD